MYWILSLNIGLESNIRLSCCRWQAEQKPILNSLNLPAEHVRCMHVRSKTRLDINFYVAFHHLKRQANLDVIYHENIYFRNSSWFFIFSRFSVYPEIHRLKAAASFKTITFVKKKKHFSARNIKPEG